MRRFGLAWFWPTNDGFDRGPFFAHSLRMANSFGHLFRITTWGESHGGGVGVVVDGCPPRLKLTEADIQPDLDRRRPGQSQHRHAAQGSGHACKSFPALSRAARSARPSACGSRMRTPVPRPTPRWRPNSALPTRITPTPPSIGIRNWQGGGRTSARETIGRVAAGAIAKKILRERFGVEVLAYVKQVQRLIAEVNPEHRQVCATSNPTSSAARTPPPPQR